MVHVGIWCGFALYVVIALVTQWDNDLLRVDSSVGGVRWVLIMMWLSFCTYSLVSAVRENFFKALRTMLQSYWGRQICIDLYISVLLSIGLVWMVTSSVIETILWSLAIIPFANLAILLFVILRLDDILAAFGLA
ncbi:MAG: hypothetical protein AAF511_12205 [Pseudomonadota bacterium]